MIRQSAATSRWPRLTASATTERTSGLMRTSYRVPSSVDRGYLPYREARPPS
ncbi:hypothetical protein I553_4001 [Mycobacterium xenopi 4042]|uniref:Uncharacterized protein n=1 Tax=Mycobacterium xenopi 4042 TaxID=1299334 RepID=X8AJK2_MYCXE|nr:hypothetical protein I553_4001 [Mycobacterium xenopi 4042]